MAKFDLDDNGYIEFNEFKNLILDDGDSPRTRGRDGASGGQALESALDHYAEQWGGQIEKTYKKFANRSGTIKKNKLTEVAKHMLRAIGHDPSHEHIRLLTVGVHSTFAILRQV